MGLNNKRQSTLDEIFEEPTPSDIEWSDIEKLFRALGASIKEGKGSRIRVRLGSENGVFHRPHPEKEACKGAVESVKKFLVRSGVLEDV